MAGGWVGVVLVWSGVVVAAGTALRLLFAGDTLMRLHLIAPGTAVAAPLVLAGLVLAAWSSWHDILKLAVIGVLLLATGPATVVTAARAAGRRKAGEPGGPNGG